MCEADEIIRVEPEEMVQVPGESLRAILRRYEDEIYEEALNEIEYALERAGDEGSETVLIASWPLILLMDIARDLAPVLEERLHFEAVAAAIEWGVI